MLDASTLIAEVLVTLKEPTTDGSAEWSHAEILRRLNISQDEIAMAIPDLVRTIDTSLVTVASSAGYTIPTTIGKIYQVRVSGEPLIQTSFDALDGDSKRGILQENWGADTGTPTHWYTQNGTLYLYPYASTAGLTITINGELMLTQMTNSTSSYPFETLAYLRKGQKILIFLAAAWCAMEEGRNQLYQILKGEAEQQIDRLRNDWVVLRTTDPQSTLVCKESECEEE